MSSIQVLNSPSISGCRPAKQLTVMTWNVHGFSEANAAEWVHLCAQHRPDVWLLQELVLHTMSECTELSESWKSMAGKAWTQDQVPHIYGLVGIVFERAEDWSVIDIVPQIGLRGVRVLHATCIFLPARCKMVISACYLPAKIDQRLDMLKHPGLQFPAEAPLLLAGGDFNEVIHRKLDSEPERRNYNWSALHQQVSALSDPFRYLHPSAVAYSRVSNNCKSRIDFFLESAELNKALIDCLYLKLLDENSSDHTPVCVSYDLGRLEASEIGQASYHVPVELDALSCHPDFEGLVREAIADLKLASSRDSAPSHSAQVLELAFQKAASVLLQRVAGSLRKINKSLQERCRVDTTAAADQYAEVIETTRRALALEPRRALWTLRQCKQGLRFLITDDTIRRSLSAASQERSWGLIRRPHLDAGTYASATEQVVDDAENIAVISDIPGIIDTAGFLALVKPLSESDQLAIESLTVAQIEEALLERGGAALAMTSARAEALHQALSVGGIAGLSALCTDVLAALYARRLARQCELSETPDGALPLLVTSALEPGKGQPSMVILSLELEDLVIPPSWARMLVEHLCVPSTASRVLQAATGSLRSLTSNLLLSALRPHVGATRDLGPHGSYTFGMYSSGLLFVGSDAGARAVISILEAFEIATGCCLRGHIACYAWAERGCKWAPTIAQQITSKWTTSEEGHPCVEQRVLRYQGRGFRLDSLSGASASDRSDASGSPDRRDEPLELLRAEIDFGAKCNSVASQADSVCSRVKAINDSMLPAIRRFFAYEPFSSHLERIDNVAYDFCATVDSLVKLPRGSLFARQEAGGFDLQSASTAVQVDFAVWLCKLLAENGEQGCLLRATLETTLSAQGLAPALLVLKRRSVWQGRTVKFRQSGRKQEREDDGDHGLEHEQQQHRQQHQRQQQEQGLDFTDRVLCSLLALQPHLPVALLSDQHFLDSLSDLEVLSLPWYHPDLPAPTWSQSCRCPSPERWQERIALLLCNGYVSWAHVLRYSFDKEPSGGCRNCHEESEAGSPYRSIESIGPGFCRSCVKLFERTGSLQERTEWKFHCRATFPLVFASDASHEDFTFPRLSPPSKFPNRDPWGRPRSGKSKREAVWAFKTVRMAWTSFWNSMPAPYRQRIQRAARSFTPARPTSSDLEGGRSLERPLAFPVQCLPLPFPWRALHFGDGTALADLTAEKVTELVCSGAKLEAVSRWGTQAAAGATREKAGKASDSRGKDGRFKPKEHPSEADEASGGQHGTPTRHISTVPGFEGLRAFWPEFRRLCSTLPHQLSSAWLLLLHGRTQVTGRLVEEEPSASLQQTAAPLHGRKRKRGRSNDTPPPPSHIWRRFTCWRCQEEDDDWHAFCSPCTGQPFWEGFYEAIKPFFEVSLAQVEQPYPAAEVVLGFPSLRKQLPAPEARRLLICFTVAVETIQGVRWNLRRALFARGSFEVPPLRSPYLIAQFQQSLVQAVYAAASSDKEAWKVRNSCWKGGRLVVQNFVEAHEPHEAPDPQLQEPHHAGQVKARDELLVPPTSTQAQQLRNKGQVQGPMSRFLTPNPKAGPSPFRGTGIESDQSGDEGDSASALEVCQSESDEEWYAERSEGDGEEHSAAYGMGVERSSIWENDGERMVPFAEWYFGARKRLGGRYWNGTAPASRKARQAMSKVRAGAV